MQDDIGIGSADYAGFDLLGSNPLDFPGPDKVSGIGALPARAGSWAAQPRSTQHFEQATASFHSSSHTFGPGEPARQCLKCKRVSAQSYVGTAIRTRTAGRAELAVEGGEGVKGAANVGQCVSGDRCPVVSLRQLA